MLKFVWNREVYYNIEMYHRLDPFFHIKMNAQRAFHYVLVNDTIKWVETFTGWFRYTSILFPLREANGRFYKALFFFF